MTPTTIAANAGTLLFVPGDRPDRFAKAVAADPDLVVLDLEDAVPAARKGAARDEVVRWLAGHRRCAVRINAPASGWYADDLAAIEPYSPIVMLPKAESAEAVSEVGRRVPAVIALVETAEGVLNARAVAGATAVRRLAFGSFDLAAQLGIDPADREALVGVRTALVLASAAAGLPGPVDGVTADVRDSAKVADDVRYARRLGFAGKLCIHPNQLSAAKASLRPTAAEVEWARSVVDALGPSGVSTVNGQLVDKPVIDRARRILRQGAN